MSTITNERLEKLSLQRDELLAALEDIIAYNVQYAIDKYGDASKAETMACVRRCREAIARAAMLNQAPVKQPSSNKVVEPVVCPKCGNTGSADSGGVHPWGEPILIDCDCTAPPAPGTDDDSLPYDPQIAEYEQMMEAEQAQADTTAQQFESLAGKAVVPISYLQGHKDGLEWAARLAEANHPQTSDWLYDDPLELAKAIRKGPDMPGSNVDGWIPCSERMPPENTGVLVATEFDGPGDWRMKWGTRVPGHPDAKNGWLIPGASWTPSHWQPLPEPPCK